MGGIYNIKDIKKKLEDQKKTSLYENDKEIHTQIDAIIEEIDGVTPEVPVKNKSSNEIEQHKVDDPASYVTQKLAKAKDALTKAKAAYDKLQKDAKKINKKYEKLKDAINKADKIGKISKKSKKQKSQDKGADEKNSAK